MSETVKHDYKVSLQPGTKFTFDNDDRLVGIETPRSNPRKAVIRLCNTSGNFENTISIESKLSIDEIKDIAKALI